MDALNQISTEGDQEVIHFTSNLIQIGVIMSLFTCHERAVKLNDRIQEEPALSCTAKGPCGDTCIDRAQQGIEEAKMDCPGLLAQGLISVDTRAWCLRCRVKGFAGMVPSSIRRVMNDIAFKKRAAEDNGEVEE